MDKKDSAFLTQPQKPKGNSAWELNGHGIEVGRDRMFGIPGRHDTVNKKLNVMVHSRKGAKVPYPK